jgi:hypothetical protein
MQNIANRKTEEPDRREEWTVSHDVLLNRLAPGWQASSADVARDFVSRWSARLQCNSQIQDAGDSFLSFVADLGAIRFTGMQEANCLLVSGTPDAAREAAQYFWRRISSPGRAILIVAASRAAEVAISEALPKDRQAILGPEAVVSLLESDSPLNHLKRVICSQVARRRLIPFDTEHPVEGPMFCGRTRMLNRLLEEEDVNFAVAGPGRIGKTSLLRRFLYTVLRSGDRSWASRFYIDLMPCHDHTVDGLARFIALKIEASSKVSHLTCDRLEPFLTFQRSHHGRPIDLILDETDEFLHLETFQVLGNAARKGLCRIVLAGRGNLLRTVLNEHSRLCNRIELLRLDPLSETEAEALLVRPLEDMGFRFAQKCQVLNRIFGLTGRLPQYIQFYGRRICELMIDEGSDTVCPALVARVRDEFETLQLFSGPIFEVKAPRVRYAALALLGIGHRALTMPQIQGVLHNQGLIAPLDEVWEIANELVIQNVLAWNQGRFQIANESLPHYVHTSDFLSSAMRELRPQMSGTC